MRFEEESIGYCRVHGSTSTSESCLAYAEYPFGSEISPGDLCFEGICLTTDPYFAQNPAAGICFEYCNPDNSFSGNDDCGIGKNCLQYSTIINNPTDPNFLYRTPETGICVSRFTSDEIFAAGIITCNLITNMKLEETGTPPYYCPLNTICKPYSSGSRMGYCADYDDLPDNQNLKGKGEFCPLPTFPNHLGDVSTDYQCDVGLGCIFSDPLNGVFSDYKCRFFCDPEDQSDLLCETKVPGTICKSISELYALENDLPNSPDSSPSRLGYCVPIETSQN